jgi:Iap family predicted aminopeptidase
VWVGAGTEADFMGRDVTGKAAVTIGYHDGRGRSNTAMSNGVVDRAAEAGAAALVIIYALPGNWQQEPARTSVTIPVFHIGNDDGRALRAMIEQQASPTIHMRLEVETRTELKTASVLGVLPGRTDETVLIQAHTEGWFQAALDNASGMATMLGLAEYYASLPRAERRRTMVFYTGSTHEVRAEGAGIEWIFENMTEMFDKAALIINCEHTAQAQTYVVRDQLITTNTVSARRWYVGGSDELKAIVKTAFRDFGMALYANPETRPGGELGRVYTGGPSVHVIDHTLYHTSIESPEIVPAYGLEQTTRVFAKIIDEVNQLDLTALRQNIPVPTERSGPPRF